MIHLIIILIIRVLSWDFSWYSLRLYRVFLNFFSECTLGFLQEFFRKSSKDSSWFFPKLFWDFFKIIIVNHNDAAVPKTIQQEYFQEFLQCSFSKDQLFMSFFQKIFQKSVQRLLQELKDYFKILSKKIMGIFQNDSSGKFCMYSSKISITKYFYTKLYHFSKVSQWLLRKCIQPVVFAFYKKYALV